MECRRRRRRNKMHQTLSGLGCLVEHTEPDVIVCPMHSIWSANAKLWRSAGRTIIRNTEVASLTGLCPVLDLITRRRNVVFGHIARLSEDTPAHQALRCHVNSSLGHLPDQGWRHRPSNRWIDQIRRDNNNRPPADLWRRSIVRGHSEVMLRSLPTTR